MKYLPMALLLGEGFIHARNLHTTDEYREMFEAWKDLHGISFQDENEYEMRLKIFIDTSDMIEMHNSKESSYSLAHNAYSHLTMEEFSRRMLTGQTKRRMLRANPYEIHKNPSNISIVPTSWDWVSRGAVTAVKDQGKCS